LGWPEKMLEFHAWYLKEKKFIERTDTGGFAITASGVDELEKDGMILGKDRLLPEKADPDEAVDSIRLLEHISAETADKFGEAIANLDKKLAVNPDHLMAWVYGLHALPAGSQAAREEGRGRGVADQPAFFDRGVCADAEIQERAGPHEVSGVFETRRPGLKKHLDSGGGRSIMAFQALSMMGMFSCRFEQALFRGIVRQYPPIHHHVIFSSPS